MQRIRYRTIRVFSLSLLITLAVVCLWQPHEAMAAPGGRLLDGAFGRSLAPSWREGKSGILLASMDLRSVGAHVGRGGSLGVMRQAQSIFGTSTGGIIGSLLIAGVVVVGIVGPAIAMKNRSGYLPWGIVGVAAGGIGLTWTLILMPGGVSMFWISLPLFAASVVAVVLGSICLVRWSRHRRRYRRRRRRRYRRRRRRRRYGLHHSSPTQRYFPPVVSGTPLTLSF